MDRLPAAALPSGDADLEHDRGDADRRAGRAGPIAELATVVPGLCAVRARRSCGDLRGHPVDLRPARGVAADRWADARAERRRRWATSHRRPREHGGERAGDGPHDVRVRALSRPEPGEHGAAARAATSTCTSASRTRSTARGRISSAPRLYIPRQPAAGAEDHHGAGNRHRHHHAGRRPAVVADRMAALDPRADCEHHDPEREDPRARLPADRRAARGRHQSRQRVRMFRVVQFIGRWSMVDVFVDTFTGAGAAGRSCPSSPPSGSSSSRRWSCSRCSRSSPSIRG